MPLDPETSSLVLVVSGLGPRIIEKIQPHIHWVCRGPEDDVILGDVRSDRRGQGFTNRELVEESIDID